MSSVQQCLEAIRGLDLSSSPASRSARISDLSEGGYLELVGVTYRVEKIYRYLEVKWSSFKKPKKEYWVTELELLNVLTGQRKYLEWEIDDEIEIGETLRNVRLSDIKTDGRPVTRRHLEAIADEEEGVVTVDGTEYHYSDDDSWAALFFRQPNDSAPLQVRMYEFASSQDEYLTVEMWEDDEDKPEREAFLSRAVDDQSVVILQAGPATSAT